MAAQTQPLWWRMGEGWLPRHWPYAIAIAVFIHMAAGSWWLNGMMHDTILPAATVIEFNLKPVADKAANLAAQEQPTAQMPDSTDSITASLSAPLPQAKPSDVPLEVTDTDASHPTDAMLRYEQQLSGWIQKHRIYPAEAESKVLTGHAVLRIRINRDGVVQQASLEVTSGHKLLDDSALTMVRQASPMPAVPDSYPKAEFLDFLVPVQFR